MDSEDYLVLISVMLLTLACLIIYNYQVDFNNLKVSYIKEKLYNHNTTKVMSELYNNRTSIELIAMNITQDIRSFYNYNVSRVGKDLTDEELKTSGGVCLHYAEYAKKEALKQGVYAIVPIIGVNDTTAHAFAVISNAEGYCIIDQQAYTCHRLS